MCDDCVPPFNSNLIKPYRKTKTMTRLALAFLLPCILAMSGCGAMRWMSEAPQNASSCAGWNKIRIKPETAVYLVKNDFSASIDIDSHNLNGQRNGCWK
jgi:hypothetical protein